MQVGFTLFAKNATAHFIGVFLCGFKKILLPLKPFL